MFGLKFSKKGCLITAVIVLLAVGILFSDGPKGVDYNNLPPFIDHDFIDLAKIESISKYRSGSGHDYSFGSGESCRSLKHYYNTKQTPASNDYKNSHQGLPPEFTKEAAIPIYSPVDGEIAAINSEQVPIGEQLDLKVKQYPRLLVRLFHIYTLPDIKKGQTITAGQPLGYIGQYQNTDIAVFVRRGLTKTNYYSYFDLMTDRLFATYQERGIKDRASLIISRAERDRNPLGCDGERFLGRPDNPDDVVLLSN